MSNLDVYLHLRTIDLSVHCGIMFESDVPCVGIAPAVITPMSKPKCVSFAAAVSGSGTDAECL